MDTIESAARKRHGDFMYRLTWEARKTERKWLWILVSILATIKFVWLQVFVFVAVVIIMNTLTKQPALAFTWHVALLGLLLVPILMPMMRPKQTIAVISSYYSVAADMKRSGGGAWRKLMFYSNGGAAFVLAMLIAIFHKNSLLQFGVTELDVLGNVFSKAKKWGLAREIFKEIGRRYDYRKEAPGSARQVAVSFGLACKWIMDDPQMADWKPKLKQAMIDIMAEYPDLSEEVTMRYMEALIGPFRK